MNSLRFGEWWVIDLRALCYMLLSIAPSLNSHKMAAIDKLSLKVTAKTHTHHFLSLSPVTLPLQVPRIEVYPPINRT